MVIHYKDKEFLLERFGFICDWWSLENSNYMVFVTTFPIKVK